MGKFKLSKDEIKHLIDMKGGCMASNKITVDGARVGYMYREEPSKEYPDTGWRFFAGDEDEEYCNNPDNFNIFELNTICNYDESIIEKLNASIGSAFVKTGGSFEEVVEN